MRRFLTCLPLFALAMPIAVAQQQVGPNGVKAPTLGQPLLQTGSTELPNVSRPKAPDQVTLTHLRGWEAAMKEVKTYYSEATLTTKDTATEREKTYVAKMWLLKPNLARIDIEVPPAKPGAAPDLETMVISNGKMMFHYDVLSRLRKSFNLGPNGTGNNVLMELMVGMSVEQLTNRFEVSTLGSDGNFIQLKILPFHPEDKEDFTSITMYLCDPKFKDRAYVPRQVVINGSLTSYDGNKQKQEIWDFPDPKVNPRGKNNQEGITEAFFKPVPVPLGWKDEYVDRQRNTPAPAPGPRQPGK